MQLNSETIKTLISTYPVDYRDRRPGLNKPLTENKPAICNLETGERFPQDAPPDTLGVMTWLGDDRRNWWITTDLHLWLNSEPGQDLVALPESSLVCTITERLDSTDICYSLHTAIWCFATDDGTGGNITVGARNQANFLSFANPAEEEAFKAWWSADSAEPLDNWLLRDAELREFVGSALDSDNPRFGGLGEQYFFAPVGDTGQLELLSLLINDKRYGRSIRLNVHNFLLSVDLILEEFGAKARNARIERAVREMKLSYDAVMEEAAGIAEITDECRAYYLAALRCAEAQLKKAGPANGSN
jgi:hypothetical protein